ncbi:hypothetical protein [Agromyces sp. Soil535]|uniref:hypothetical protein n=1 Tax=Agromyces sp. Soil535 TaxID=1736390 RepID=UPI001910D347|nr:hypothetical protein [Agromyces sp. Soil535]
MSRAIAEIGVDRLFDGVPPGQQRGLERAQILLPFRERWRSVAEEGGALNSEDVAEELRICDLWCGFSRESHGLLLDGVGGHG